ncbi:hypothetical protein C10C_0745 [Chlamydia serpentis]|uniref:Uncharacterized protein n=1 Tax=Chlamydia serpentis TaxID=1967782 RepID=A0A2R8FBS5_9CHLA|nr:hypothetical protein [Chlamydia serpentis]SPN73889.1 hypothetical protein C10C_0745 [Chlamydia serpentis]
MNESIRSVCFQKTPQLTAKSVVSMEMSLTSEQLSSAEEVTSLANLEADFLRAEALLVEMREIRSCLEQSLRTLVPGE